MSEYLVEVDEFSDEPETEVVHWMAPKPLSVGATGLAATASAAFVLGALTAVGVLAALRWLDPHAGEDRPRFH